MKNLEQYIAEVEKWIPELEERLQPGAAAEEIAALEKAVGVQLPGEFKELYAAYNGEAYNVSDVGLIGGFRFLSIEGVLEEYRSFQNLPYEMTAIGTGAIQQNAMEELTWVPFAHDGSRGFIALDLSPSKTGKAGQIITVDLDMDQSYRLADDVDELFAKMKEWLKTGTLQVVKESGSLCLIAGTGHLFNILDTLALPQPSDPEGRILLQEGYWTDRYAKQLQENADGSKEIATEILSKEKRLLIKEKQISCIPFAYMDNLKELVMHDCELQDVYALAQSPQLQKLILVNCTLQGEDLSILAAAPKLKELSLNVMRGEGLEVLNSIKTLKTLRLRKVEGVAEDMLATFSNLQELHLEDMGLDGAFLRELKNLKLLNLHYEKLADLNFLKDLKKLTEFELAYPAQNEEGLTGLAELKKLKRFIYPVRDLSVYKDCEAIENIGIAADVQRGFEVLSGSKVNGFTVCGNISSLQLEAMAKEIRKYTTLVSYGSRSMR